MKRQITMLLCVLFALLSTATLPALAAETQYPISVEEYTYGPLDEPRINKVYQLSLSDDPSGIPTGDFERNGRHYYLLDLTRQDNVGVDTRLYTETITMDSDTGELSAILKKLDGAKEATTEDGYAGTLILDHTSVKVEVKGYQTTTRNLSAKRTYPSLSDADLSLIPKTITDNGRTLTLADVQWTSDGTYYTAAAEYTGTAASRSATGYTVTVNYTGKVAKTNCNSSSRLRWTQHFKEFSAMTTLDRRAVIALVQSIRVNAKDDLVITLRYHIEYVKVLKRLDEMGKLPPDLKDILNNLIEEAA